MSTPEIVLPKVLSIARRAMELDAEDPNEARVRLEIIDEILIAMGWRKESFHPESYDGNGGFTDYLLKSHDTPFLVVEAKRSGRPFSLPKNIKGRRVKVGTLASGGGSDLCEALEQAARYCNNHGAPFACVTNGLQWVFFRGTAHRQRGWRENMAVCFRDVDELESEGIEFWNLLHFACVIEGVVPTVLDGEALPQASFAKRPYGHLPQAADALSGSREMVNQLVEFYFSDIIEADQGDMLKACYVEDQRVSEYDKELGRLLNQQLLSLERTEAEQATTEALVEALTGPLPDDSARVVLVVGQVGAGKSTFLGRFFHKVEGPNNGEHSFWSYKIDLKRRAEAAGMVPRDEAVKLSERILEHISGRVHRTQRNEYDPYDGKTLRTIFGQEISRLKRGPYADKFERDPQAFEVAVADELERLRCDSTKLLPRYMKYVYSRAKRPFCLIIDNVDRSSDDYQKFVYTFCRGLAREVPGIILIAMRDTTYWRARVAGFLDTDITDTVFEVRPPSLKSVISKRVKYARQHIKDPEGREVPQGRRKVLDKIEAACDHIQEVLLSNDASGMQLLTGLGNRSVRRGLWLLKLYLQAPSSLDPVPAGGAKAHLLRALMLGSQRCYDSQISPIINLFRAEGDYRGSYALNLIALAYLAHLAQRSLRLTAAPTVAEVVDELVGFGFHRQLAQRAIEVLVESGLVESDNRYIETPDTERRGQRAEGRSPVDGSDKLRISPSGLEYLRMLSRDSEYHLHCAGDSYWYDEEPWAKFVQTMHEGLEAGTGAEWIELRKELLGIWFIYVEREVRDELRGLSIPAGSASGAVIRDAIRHAFPDPNEQARSQEAEGDVAPEQHPRLFPDTMSELLIEASAALPPVTEETRVHGSGELARVLWVLELARRASLGPLSTRRMESLLRTWGHVQFVSNNIGRFFRSRCEAGWKPFWREVKGPYGTNGRPVNGYELTEVGRKEFDLQRPAYEGTGTD